LEIFPRSVFSASPPIHVMKTEKLKVSWKNKEMKKKGGKEDR
jgi:hypothetical protein